MPAIPEARPPPWNQTSTEVAISKSIAIQMVMSYSEIQKRADRPVPKSKTTCTNKMVSNIRFATLCYLAGRR